jgi:membrane protein YqaA with SNARE-associated domain
VTDDERQDLKDQLLMADLALKKKQAFWETPKGFAAIIAALAVTIGTIGGVVGYQIGRTPPQAIVVQFQQPLGVKLLP